jgi:hypothetical protein
MNIGGKIAGPLSAVALIPEAYNFAMGLKDVNKPLDNIEDLRMPGIASAVAKWMAGSGNNNLGKIYPEQGENNATKGGASAKPSDVPTEDLPALPGFNIPYTESQLTKLGLINDTGSNSPNQEVLEGRVESSNKDNNRLSNESIDKYIELLRDINNPYIEALNRYLYNYPKNLDQARRADLYFNGANLAYGFNPKAGEKFNPLQNQAEIINTLKLIRDAKMGDINAINELQGNMAVADELELPPEAAFANKNLLTALSQEKKYATDLEKAKIVDAMRRFGYNTNFWRALLQQDLKNQGAIDVANIYAGSYNPGVGLSQGGVPVNQQTYSPLPQQQDAYAQAFAQFANK